MCKVTSKLGNDSASANITIVDSNGKRYLLHCISQAVRGEIKRVVINQCVKSHCEQTRNMERKPYTSSILGVFHKTHFDKGVSSTPGGDINLKYT